MPNGFPASSRPGSSSSGVKETSLCPGCYGPSDSANGSQQNKAVKDKKAYPFLKVGGPSGSMCGPSLHLSLLSFTPLALHTPKHHIHTQGFQNHLEICRCLGERWSPPSPYSSPRQRNTHLMNGPLAKAGCIIAIWGFGGCSPLPPSNSLPPAGCPTVQLSADTTHLERASEATG